MIYAVISLNYDIIIYKEISIKIKVSVSPLPTLQLKVSRVWYDLHIDLLDWNETVQVYLWGYEHNKRPNQDLLDIFI